MSIGGEWFGMWQSKDWNGVPSAFRFVMVIVVVLVFSIFVDGAGYVYRIANHYPLTGNVPGLPPNFGTWQLYIHRGLDLNGGTHIDY